MLFQDISTFQWIVLCACGFFVGVSKTGLPGIGVLCVPFMALVFPAKASTGLLLPMLAMADIAAIIYYRRDANWQMIRHLMPWALSGLAAGSIVIYLVTDEQLKPIIGLIVLSMVILHFWRNRHGNAEAPQHWSFAAIMGFTAGLATQMANAAGPVMAVYFLAMKLPKNEFVGTAAWYIFILNTIKLGLFTLDKRITWESASADLMVIPFIAVGAILGIFVLKKIQQKHFDLTVQWLAAIAALKLLF